jgi:hypothetical protein
MKLIIVLTCLIFSGIGYSGAQTKEDAKERVRKPEVPIVIMNSIVRDFPEFKFDLASVQSRISYNNRDNQEPTRYNVMAKGEKSRHYALYDKDGSLIQSRQINKDIRLPKLVRNSLGSNYDGWTMLKNREIVKLHDKKPQSYTVLMARGKDRKKVQLDLQGNILKERKRLRLT